MLKNTQYVIETNAKVNEALRIIGQGDKAITVEIFEYETIWVSKEELTAITKLTPVTVVEVL